MATPDPRVPLAWAARAVPLPPCAVVGRGDVARALGRRLAALDDESLAALTVAAGPGALVVVGDAAALPWVDGVVYLGRDPEAPELLMPTAIAPTVSAAVVARAIAARAGATTPAWPVAVVPAPLTLISCGAARAIERARLHAWLEAP